MHRLLPLIPIILALGCERERCDNYVTRAASTDGSPETFTNDARFSEALQLAQSTAVANKYIDVLERSIDIVTTNASVTDSLDELCASTHLQDIRDAPPNILQLARSVCAIVGPASLKKQKDGWCLVVDPCERYKQHRATSIIGTGFLYEENAIATAGHLSKFDVHEFYVVFDFVTSDATPRGRTFFGDDQVRRVKYARPKHNDSDWMLLEIDPVPGRRPLAVDLSPVHSCDDTSECRDSVFALGHPWGLPMKYHGPAEVVCSRNACSYFVSRLLMYENNSGSPVLRHGTDRVVGIHDEAMCVSADLCAAVISSKIRASCMEHQPCCGSDHTRITELLGAPLPLRPTIITAESVAIIDVARVPEWQGQRVLLVTSDAPLTLNLSCESVVGVLSCSDSTAPLGWYYRVVSPGRHFKIGGSASSLCVDMKEWE